MEHHHSWSQVVQRHQISEKVSKSHGYSGVLKLNRAKQLPLYKYIYYTWILVH